jgi:hypothetical protein
MSLQNTGTSNTRLMELVFPQVHEEIGRERGSVLILENANLYSDGRHFLSSVRTGERIGGYADRWSSYPPSFVFRPR